MNTAEKPVPQKRKWGLLRFLGYSLMLLLTVLVLAGAGAGVAGYLLYNYITQETVASGPAIRVEIPAGVTGAETGVLLANAGLIAHPVLFRAAIEFDKSGKPVKHGIYELEQGLSPMQMLARLQEGPNVPIIPQEVAGAHKVTLPEGLTINQMAALFDEPGKFRQAAADPALIARLGVEAGTLEGFLMPNTYYYSSEPSEEAVVDRMFEQFETELNRLTQTHPLPSGMTLKEVVTVASLVEEEARADEERPIIASVIYNRLKRGMPLELDCTLQYALDKYGQRLLNEDKEVDSPYNTYKYAGLPPGPISNPGVASLTAAIEPAVSDYLFFVSNADGRTHTFSANIREHNNAVARYRREITKQRRALREQEQQAGQGEIN